MKSIKFVFIVLPILLLTACTERIDLDLKSDENQRLVVDAWLTDEAKAHEVKLTLTTGYYNDEPPEPATGAKVQISDGTETFDLTEAYPGHYLTAADVKGIPGHTYTLTIDYNGTAYQATSKMNQTPPIDSLGYKTFDFQDTENDFTEYSILLYTTEPSTEGDNYYWKGYLVDKPTDVTRTYWEIAEDKFVNGNYINGAQVLIVEANPGDAFVFEQYNIQPEAFDFFLAVQTETIYKGSIFDTAPANVPTNLNNGALGFFLVAGVVRDTVVIK
ncbi:MAG: DUF4249 domain-containing protein [Saprospiraceae bacterium]